MRSDGADIYYSFYCVFGTSWLLLLGQFAEVLKLKNEFQRNFVPYKVEYGECIDEHLLVFIPFYVYITLH